MKEFVRIGIMGGTFNPIHIGHLIAGDCAYEQFHLKEIWYMPSKTPPHKSISGTASEKEREDMVRLAIGEHPHFKLSRMELERNGITYTVDTLRALHEKGKAQEYYFIIGADSLFDFPKWKEPEEIVKLAVILVVSRYGLAREELEKQIAYLKSLYGGKFYIVDIPTIGVSSSELRSRVKEKKSIRYLVKEKVRIYIEEHQLYQ